MAYSYMHVYLLRAGNFRSQSLAGDEAAGGTGASKWKTVLNAMRAVQGMRRPSIAQPSDSGDSPPIGGGRSSPLDPRSSVYLLC
jgi:hypothetical protein